VSNSRLIGGAFIGGEEGLKRGGKVPRDPCEWDPTRDAPATTAEGCPNQADTIVGADGKWRLCFSCARLPRFKSLRKRVPIVRTCCGGILGS